MTFVLMIALSLFLAKPAFSELPASPNTTPINQDFCYYLLDCTVSCKIQSVRNDLYLIVFPLSMDNSFPIQMSFYEQLPNGTESKVTEIIPAGGHGAHFFSTSYPRDITMIELSNEPTSTPSSATSPIPTPAQTSNPSPSLLPSESSVQTPAVPEFSFNPALVFFVFSFAVAFRHRKQVKKV